VILWKCPRIPEIPYMSLKILTLKSINVPQDISYMPLVSKMVRLIHLSFLLMWFSPKRAQVLFLNLIETLHLLPVGQRE
jgi:hypothetical protein